MDNISIFKKRFGYIPGEGSKSDKFKTGIARNGDSILYVEENDQFVRKNSLYDPKHEAERWAEGIVLKNASMCVMLNGFSDGYFVRELCKHVRLDTKIVVYERDEALLRFVLENFDISDILNNENCYIFTPIHGASEAGHIARKMMKNGIGTGIVLDAPGSEADDCFKNFTDTLTSEVASNINRNELFARDTFENDLYAFNSLYRNYLIRDFYDKFDKKMPVIVVAGGPSLLKNIDDLKEVYGRALIVATDRSVSVLLDHGIMPDVMVTADPQKKSDFISDERVRNTPLIATFGANRQALADHEGYVLYCYPEIYMDNIPGLEGRIDYIEDSGGSVATMACAVFTYIKAETVILIGQDLAYTGGQTHADNRHDEKINRDALIEVEGLHGEKLYTSGNLYAYKKFYEEEIINYPDTRIVDATEGGALIEGSQVLTLKETLDKYCRKKYDLSELLDLTAYPHAQTEEEHRNTVSYMEDRLGELKKIAENSAELEHIFSVLLAEARRGNINDSKNDHYVEMMDLLRSQTYYMEANVWLEMMWIQDVQLIPEHDYYIRTNEEAVQIFEKAYNYYKMLPDECRSLTDTIKRIFNMEF